MLAHFAGSISLRKGKQTLLYYPGIKHSDTTRKELHFSGRVLLRYQVLSECTHPTYAGIENRSIHQPLHMPALDFFRSATALETIQFLARNGRGKEKTLCLAPFVTARYKVR